jgi:hypothetical protein
VTRQQYVGTLAISAALILAGGSALKPAKGVPQIVVSDPEIERLAQRRSLEAASQWFAETARRARVWTVTLPDTGAPGVLWSNGSILAGGTEPVGATVPVAMPNGARVDTVVEHRSPEVPLLLLHAPAQNLVAARRVSRLLPGARLVVVWPSGFLPAVYGGVRQSDCGETLILNVPLDAVPSGGAVFNAAGEFAGMVAGCGSSHMALSLRTLERFAGATPEAGIVARFGMRISLEDGTVLEVWNDTWADRSGILPGDVIAEPESLLTAPLEAGITVTRNGRRRTAELDVPPPAGPLQPGDRIISVDGRPASSRREVARALERNGSAFVVVERGSKKIGVAIQR